MDAATLSRLQFGATIAFHYVFPPINIGLGVGLVLMEGAYLWTRRPLYQQMTRFWVRIFGLTFAIGVATGIVMEFEFGTNWSAYSRFVGDVFGSALAAEGLFAFFMESGFLGLLLFGWTLVPPAVHFLATVLVCLGAHFSAVWIIVANSWMQTPAGFQLVGEGAARRAETTDFFAAVLNPSTATRLLHTLMGAWQAWACFVLSVGAWYVLRRRHEEFGRAAVGFGLVLGLLAAVGSLVTGDWSARVVAAHQPAKLAAMEGHYPASAPAPLHVVGWIDEAHERVVGLRIPGGLSWLVHGDSTAPVPGLASVPPADRPPVGAVFQSFHLMVLIGLGLIALESVGAWFWWRGTLFERRGLLWLFVLSVLAPQAANQLGWLVAELGRQPWIVYGLMRTADGVSPRVAPAAIVASLVLFGLVYLLLFALFLFLLDQKIRQGPPPLAVEEPHRRA